MKHLDGDIEAYKHAEALREASDGEVVDAAFADILAHRFDSPAVHEVMQRRAGSDWQYRKLKEERELAMKVARACGAAT